jgi:Asp/Glu/hydantoin racemase
MRLLIVNPNTSAGVTARIDGAAQAVAGPGDRFVTVSALSGPPLIVTEADTQAAIAGVLGAIAQHRDAVDGIVLASFGDTGAAEVRAAYPHLPVLGIAEAAFAEVRQSEGPFAIVTFAPEVAGPLLAMAKAHGVGDLLLRVATLPDPLRHDPAEIADALFDPLAALCRQCAAEGAERLVVGGGPLAGLAARIAPHCPAPLIDGTQAAISQLRARLEAGRDLPRPLRMGR